MKTIYDTISESLSSIDNGELINESTYDEYKAFMEELDKAFKDGGEAAAEQFIKNCQEEGLYEGFFGGVIGFLAGPGVGKVVARALGLEKGVLYDLLTSRLVSAALGSAIQKELKK